MKPLTSSSSFNTGEPDTKKYNINVSDVTVSDPHIGCTLSFNGGDGNIVPSETNTVQVVVFIKLTIGPSNANNYTAFILSGSSNVNFPVVSLNHEFIDQAFPVGCEGHVEMRIVVLEKGGDNDGQVRTTFIWDNNNPNNTSDTLTVDITTNQGGEVPGSNIVTFDHITYHAYV